jgi:hypothetical protein
VLRQKRCRLPDHDGRNNTAAAGRRATTTDAAGAPTILPAATTDDTPSMTAEEAQSCRLPATLTRPMAEALWRQIKYPCPTRLQDDIGRTNCKAGLQVQSIHADTECGGASLKPNNDFN